MNPSESTSAADRPPRGAAPDPVVQYAWGPWLRGAASLAVVWHLVGVMVAPISVPPQMNRGDSVLGAELKKVYEPYITATYLDHSYKFFAPNPGASHLVRFDLYFADGTKRVNRDDQVFPDRIGHWPRLLYHRHFMLTEFMNLPGLMPDPIPGVGPPGLLPTGGVGGGGRPPGMEPPGMAAGGVLPPGMLPPTAGTPIAGGPMPPLAAAPQPGPQGLPQPEGPPVPAADDVERFFTQGAEGVPPQAVPFVVGYWRAAAAYLARKHGAVRVDLFYRKHGLPSIEEYRRVGRLDAPESYFERLLATYRAEGTP